MQNPFDSVPVTKLNALMSQAEKFKTYRHEVQWLRVTELERASVERAIRPSRVDRIVRRFNANALSVLTVWAHDGHYYIIDGQHRWEACKQVGHVWVECMIYDTLTLEQAATMFHYLNTSAPPNARDLWNARVLENDPKILRIIALVESTPCEYDAQRRPARFYTINADPHHGTTFGVIGAVSALERIYDYDNTGDLLVQVLRIVANHPTWPTEAGPRAVPPALQRAILLGLGTFLNWYKGQFKPDNYSAFITKLRTYSIASITSQARDMGGPQESALIARVFWAIYNKNIKNPDNRLPDPPEINWANVKRSPRDA